MTRISRINFLYYYIILFSMKKRKITYKLESALMDKFKNVMLDPSVFTSYKHLKALQKYPEKLYVPQTFLKILIKEDIREFLAIFLRYPWVYSLKRYEYIPRDFIESLYGEKLIEYVPKESYVKEILPFKEKIKVSEDVWKVLLEEYSFLRENSCLLLRFRNTIRYFRQMGISTLDALNNLIDVKEKFFHKIRGPRWIVTIVIETSALMSSNIILGALGIILMTFDP